MNELEQIRAEIDRIDKDIVANLEKRVAAAKKVAAYKIAHNLPVLDRERERELLKSRRLMLKDQSLAKDTDRLFELLMSISRAWQSKLAEPQQAQAMHVKPGEKAAFQGVKGAHSHAALVRYFGEKTDCFACESFEDVFLAVESGEAAYGVLPIENSYTGSVLPVYDLLNRYSLLITGEQHLKIEHALVGLPGATLAEIREVYSHEQALMQCAAFLKEHPEYEQRSYFNTAGSAEFVARQNDPSKAAIASAYAAGLYGLSVLADSINASGENTTRFIVVSKNAYQGEEANKASVSFALEHKTGALAQALNLFARYGLNMVKIESRPLENRNFEYLFYVDFEGAHIRGSVDKAAAAVTGLFAGFRVLGAYRKDPA